MIEGVDPGAFSGPRRDNCAAISHSSAVTGSCRRRGDKRSAESGNSPDKSGRARCSGPGEDEEDDDDDDVGDSQQSTIESLLQLMQADSEGKSKGLHAAGKYQCCFNVCLGSFRSAPKFLEHIKKSHSKETDFLRTMENRKLVIRCQCGDFRWCRTARGHLNNCTKAQTNATSSGVSDNSVPADWIKELPWALATRARLTEPGLVCFHVGKGIVMNRRIATVLSQLLAYESDTITPIQRWVMILLLPIMILHVPSQKMDASTRKKLEADRMDSFRRGEWQQLFDSALRTIKRQQARLQGASLGEYRGETEYLQSKITKGQIADALGKQAKPTLLSRQRIEEEFVPKQFPVKPSYCHPNEDYSAEQFPTVTESMVRDALDYSKTKGCLGTSLCFWSIMFLFKPAAVTQIIEQIATNAVPGPISDILRSVNYTCLVYEDTNKLRAVGSNAALLKITQRVLLQSNKEKIQELAKTHGEFGNGVGHGATAAAVKVMGQIQEMTIAPRWQ